MAWKHHREIQNGKTYTSHGGMREDVSYIIGVIETGTSRTFNAHFIRLVWSDGHSVEAEDAHNLVWSLRKLAAELALTGISIACAGLCDDFYETGLSQNSGWGFHPRAEGAVHIMSALTQPAANSGANPETHLHS